MNNPSLQPTGTDSPADRERPARRSGQPYYLLALIGLAIGACTPTVQVVAPTEPITINLNIKLDADVRLQVEEKAREDVGTKSIF